MIKNSLSYIVIVCLVFLLSYFLIHTARAGLVSDFSDQLSSHVIASASNHTLVFTVSSSFDPDDTLEVYFESGFDLSLIDYTDIDFKDDDVDLNLGATAGAGAGSNIGVAISSQTITFTQNDTDTVAGSSVVTIAIGLNSDYQTQGDNQIYNPTNSVTYKISLSGTFGDMGTISLAILESDSVGLQAEITPELSFSIRNTADTATVSSCPIGILTSVAVSQCSYRLAAETNALNGFKVYIRSDGNLRNQENFIASISEDEQVTFGQEGYGVAVSGATGLTEVGDFADDETPIPVVDTLLIQSDSVYNYTQEDLSTSTLVTHKAGASISTKAGNYRQQIIYSILGNY